MTTLVATAFLIGVIAYSAAATLHFLDLTRAAPLAAAGRWAPRLLTLAAIAHLLHVVATSVLSDHCPVSTLRFALSLSALIATVGYLTVGTRKLFALGAIVAPLALCSLVSAQVLGNWVRQTQMSRSLLAVHVTVNLVGLAMFLLAGAASAFYLVHRRSLKRKHQAPGASRLPSLDTLDRAAHRLLLAGFPLLTLGIVTGAVPGADALFRDAVAVSRAVLAFGGWFLLAGVLLLRRLAGWSGKRAALGTLAGVACIATVLGMYLLATAGGRL